MRELRRTAVPRPASRSRCAERPSDWRDVQADVAHDLRADCPGPWTTRICTTRKESGVQVLRRSQPIFDGTSPPLVFDYSNDDDVDEPFQTSEIFRVARVDRQVPSTGGRGNEKIQGP